MAAEQNPSAAAAAAVGLLNAAAAAATATAEAATGGTPSVRQSNSDKLERQPGRMQACLDTSDQLDVNLIAAAQAYRMTVTDGNATQQAINAAPIAAAAATTPPAAAAVPDAAVFVTDTPAVSAGSSPTRPVLPQLQPQAHQVEADAKLRDSTSNPNDVGVMCPATGSSSSNSKAGLVDRSTDRPPSAPTPLKPWARSRASTSGVQALQTLQVPKSSQGSQLDHEWHKPGSRCRPPWQWCQGPGFFMWFASYATGATGDQGPARRPGQCCQQGWECRG
jgi:hypothetical protein